MSTQTMTKAAESFKTPPADSPIWNNDDHVPYDETIIRTYHQAGKLNVLVETIKTKVFIETKEVTRTGRAKLRPLHISTFRLHLKHKIHNWVRTFKIYRHQGKWLYADSGDYTDNQASKTITKDRATMVALLARFSGLSIGDASHEITTWTGQ